MYVYYQIRETFKLDEKEASPLALFIPALKDEAFRALGKSIDRLTFECSRTAMISSTTLSALSRSGSSISSNIRWALLLLGRLMNRLASAAVVNPASTPTPLSNNSAITAGASCSDRLTEA